MSRIFILSPARTTGKRAALLWNERAQFETARRLRTSEGIPVGEAFAFLSGLYFRGKLAYARHFAAVLPGRHGAYVITSNAGLVPVDEPVTLERLRCFGDTPIDPAEPGYAVPLRRTACELAGMLPNYAEAVLLGSIATGKYADVLVESFGRRLLFPTEFVGRGDMSRGGLLLRAVRANAELTYEPLVDAATRVGKRPPKLGPLR